MVQNKTVLPQPAQRLNPVNRLTDLSSPGTFGKISALSLNHRIKQFVLKLEL
jgi:hypothetical protein